MAALGEERVRVVAESVLALIILVAAICGQTARAAAAEELIKFESAEFLVGQIQQRLARERGDTPKVTSETIEGYLSNMETHDFPATQLSK